jgi:hypothetical protein
MFKKLEKRYMHYKVKLMMIVHEFDASHHMLNTDKSRKLTDRIDRV